MLSEPEEPLHVPSSSWVEVSLWQVCVRGGLSLHLALLRENTFCLPLTDISVQKKKCRCTTKSSLQQQGMDFWEQE